MEMELRIAPARYNQPKPAAGGGIPAGPTLAVSLLPLFLSTIAIIIPGRKIIRRKRWKRRK